MSRYWSSLAREIDPYVPGEQPRDKKYIKLNTNENPYPPSPKAVKAMQAAVDDSLRLYPDPLCTGLRESLAHRYGLNTEQVFVGNGSDEILAFCFMAFFEPGRTVLMPDISYSFYPVYASVFNIDYRAVPVGSDFSVPVEPFFNSQGGVVISNPNSPTGMYMPLDSVKSILENNTGCVVIMDEAYIDFGGESAACLINEYPNLIVVQTLSKSRSLAGLRVGFALGSRELIEGLERIKNSFNSYTLDRIALAGAAAAVKDEEYFKETCAKIAATRDGIIPLLREMGFDVPDSKANFVFASHNRMKARDIFEQLRERGILVRYFSKPRIDNHLRITIGTDAEMDSLIDALSDIARF